MKSTLIVALLATGATVAAATPVKNSGQVAYELGSVLAAEEFCGFKYDQKMIAAFIEKNVPADDMGFAPFLQVTTRGKLSKQKNMTGAAKAAHCAQIERVARANSFIQ